MQTFGIDWEGPMPHPDNKDTVAVPEINCPLDLYVFDELDDVIQPLAETTNYGIDLYEKF